MRLDVKNERNLSMLVDFYEFTMSNVFMLDEKSNTKVVFELFFRKSIDGATFAIVGGIEQMIDYISNLRFTSDDIEYLRSKNCFDERFLEYLANFKFTGSIYAMKEGTVVFPSEPIVTVIADTIQAQLIETMLLLTINHQSLIATKANRIVRAANGKTVLELGARRAHGADAAIYGARAAYVGGVDGTATVSSDIEFGIPASGTMAHAFVQLYEDEYLAFKTYATHNPDNCVFLVDTYNVLKSGVPNAIKVAKEILIPQGKTLKGIRLDSGDLAYLSKQARKMLDENGLTDCKIIASNSLDEYTITELEQQGACIDIYGVGERMIVSKSTPVFGGVYKLAAVSNGEEFVPRIKVSENAEKVTNPGYKKVWRFYDENNIAIADVLTTHDEVIDNSKSYEIFHPIHTWKRKTLTNFTVKELQVPVFIDGECVYKKPALNEIRKYCREEVASLPVEVKRFTNPHEYHVDLSLKLWNIKNELIAKHNAK